METIEAIVLMSLSAYILGLLMAGWMFNRQTKLVEHFKLDNDQLELENLTLRQQNGSYQRRNKELQYHLDEIKEINDENNKRIAMLSNEVENFRSDVLRLRNQVIRSERDNLSVDPGEDYGSDKVFMADKPTNFIK